MAVNSPLRSLLKGLIETRSVVRFGYGVGVNAQSYIRSLLDQYYEAYSLQCRAVRYIGLTSHSTVHERAMAALLASQCCNDGALGPIRDNQFLQQFRMSKQAARIRSEFLQFDRAHLVRLRQPKAVTDEGREGNLIVLKRSCSATGEKGVLLLKYNQSFEEFAALYDLSRIAQHYRLVLEPSWTPNILPAYSLFAGCDLEMVIQCNQANEVAFLGRLLCNVHPLLCSSSDWVDEDLFVPSNQKEFDIVFVASWAKIKRHRVLFRALSQLANPCLRVALIGYSMERNIDAIRGEMQSYGVESQCEIYERISPSQVSQIMAASKISLLLSKQEGGNKSVFESLFCNTPILVYRHHRGINMRCVNAETGMLADDRELPEVIRQMIRCHSEFSPRRWAEHNTGSRIATKRLEDLLRQMAHGASEKWSTGIVHKVNRPHLRYKSESDRIAMNSEYEVLYKFLLPEVRAALPD